MSSGKIVIRTNVAESATQTFTPPSSPKAGNNINIGQQLGSEIVTITVGQGSRSKTFPLHKSWLCGEVKYFASMFMGAFKEATTGTATFLYDDPAAFELFVTWLYKGTVIVPESNAESSTIETLIQLYALAEKFVIQPLADQTIAVLIHHMRNTSHEVDVGHMRLAYEITPSGSGLRRFAAMLCTFKILSDKEDDTDLAWNSGDLLGCDDLLMDIFELMSGINGKRVNDPRLVVDCEYHLHEDSVVCPYEVQAPATLTSSKKRGSKRIYYPSAKRRSPR